MCLANQLESAKMIIYMGFGNVLWINENNDTIGCDKDRPIRTISSN